MREKRVKKKPVTPSAGNCSFSSSIPFISVSSCLFSFLPPPHFSRFLFFGSSELRFWPFSVCLLLFHSFLFSSSYAHSGQTVGFSIAAGCWWKWFEDRVSECSLEETDGVVCCWSLRLPLCRQCGWVFVCVFFPVPFLSCSLFLFLPLLCFFRFLLFRSLVMRIHFSLWLFLSSLLLAFFQTASLLAFFLLSSSREAVCFSSSLSRHSFFSSSVVLSCLRCWEAPMLFIFFSLFWYQSVNFVVHSFLPSFIRSFLISICLSLLLCVFAFFFPSFSYFLFACRYQSVNLVVHSFFPSFLHSFILSSPASSFPSVFACFLSFYRVTALLVFFDWPRISSLLRKPCWRRLSHPRTHPSALRAARNWRGQKRNEEKKEEKKKGKREGKGWEGLTVSLSSPHCSEGRQRMKWERQAKACLNRKEGSQQVCRSFPSHRCQPSIHSFRSSPFLGLVLSLSFSLSPFTFSFWPCISSSFSFFLFFSSDACWLLHFSFVCVLLRVYTFLPA